MKIQKSEISRLVKESIKRNKKKNQLKERIEELEQELHNINEQENQVEEKRESIFDAKPGEIVILSFDGVTVKIQRQLDDLFKIIDASESEKLKDGDYIKPQGDDTLIPGKKFKFSVLRAIDAPYITNPLIDWKIIQN